VTATGERSALAAVLPSDATGTPGGEDCGTVRGSIMLTIISLIFIFILL
jgi:hypothetical protein